MIFLLDIVLLLNFYLALRYFKYLIAPPVLLGGGMLMASFMATTYFIEWEMDKFLFESFLILGGGPLLFTLFCMLFNRKVVARKPYNIENVLHFKVSFKFCSFYVTSILIGIGGVYLKYLAYSSFWGGADLAELIMAFRADTASGNHLFEIPKHISMISRYTNILSYYSSFFMSLLIILRKKTFFVNLLLILQILVALFDGMLSGTKGAIIEILVRWAVIYLTILYCYNKSDKLPKRFYYRTILIGLLFVLSFRGLGMLVGRSLDERTNFDVLAEYCGAEIKNFDIYMHGNDRNSQSKFMGEDCFWTLYSDLHPKYIRYPREFQYINGCHLGNVYTQYFSLHKDFGWLGVIFGSFLMALICMQVYKRVVKVMLRGKIFKMSVFIYATMALSIFMAFFSFRFSEYVITTNLLKMIIYLYILNRLFITISVVKDR